MAISKILSWLLNPSFGFATDLLDLTNWKASRNDMLCLYIKYEVVIVTDLETPPLQ